jgi:glycosyltransferase involved in cell wall biosynthesis
MQNRRVVRFLETHDVRRQFVLIANNPRFASFAANLPFAKPRDIYIVDDFVADSGIYRVSREVAHRVLDRLVMESERVFTISPVYASDLETLYGRPCEFLPIPIPDALLDTIDSKPLPREQGGGTANGIVTLHHSGQIHHLYADALISLISLSRKIAETKKIKIHLELWGKINPGDAEKALRIDLQEVNQKDNFQIKLCGEVPPLELARQQKRADFLLLVNSFLPEIEKQVRCSFSSKICEYMVSGVPILVYAPSYSSLVAHLGKYNAAHIISGQDMEEVRLQLEEILVDPQENKTVEAAKKLALNVHSSKAFFDRITEEK